MSDVLLGGLLMVAGLLGWWGIVRRTGDSLHPLGLMTLFWFVVFGFAHWNVSATYDQAYYALPIGLKTYLAAFGSYTAFFLGYWMMDPHLPALDQDALATRLRDSTHPPRLRLLAIGCFAAATATTVYYVQSVGAIPLFSPDILALRFIWKQPVTGYVWDLHYVVALFAAILIDRARTHRERVLWLAVGLASIVQLAFSGVRVSPLTAIVWVSTYVFYRRLGRVKLRHLVSLALLVFTLSSVIEYYRRLPLQLNPSWVNPDLDMSVPATVWSHTGSSFKNLQLTLARDYPPLELGGLTYDLVKTIEPEFREKESEIFLRYGTHNTATYLVDLYMDFGIFGILVMPGLYGLATAVVYRQFRRRPNIFWLVIQIDFLIAVVLAFRTHKFFGNTLIVFGAVAALTQLVAGTPVQSEGRDLDVGLDGSDLLPEGAPAA